MDAITQTALGAVIGEAGFRHKLGNKAVAFGAFCGILPDFDVLAGYFDDWAIMSFHRGYTHSLLVIPLAVPLLAWMGYRWDRGRTPFRTWAHLAFWAMVTHSLLDWCTAYGTMLFEPISAHRFALDAVSVLDPFYTVPLLLAILIGRFKRIPLGTARGIAAGVLALTTLYLALGFVQSRRAIALAEEQIKQDSVSDPFSPMEIRATPTFCNIWVWRVVARDQTGDLRLGFISTWYPRRIVFEQLNRPNIDRDRALVDGFLKHPRGQLFFWFAQETLSFKVEHFPNHTAGEPASVLTAFDQRFGLITQPLLPPFRVEAKFDERGNVLDLRRIRRSERLNAGLEVATIWHFWWTGVGIDRGE